MAIGVSSLYINGYSLDVVAPYQAVTGSVTPTAGNTVYIAVNAAAAGSTITGVTGSSISGATSVASLTDWQVWQATATGAAGAITVTFNAATGYPVFVFEVTGGATTYTQSAVGTSSGTTASATLGSAVSGATIAMTGVWAASANTDAISPKSGWTELAEDVQIDAGATYERGEIQYKVSGETGASSTWSTSRTWYMLTMEVATGSASEVAGKFLPAGF